MTWKSKGTFSMNGNNNPNATHSTVQGLDHPRVEIEGKFGEVELQGVTVLNGDKCWQKFGRETKALDGDMLANEKRVAYLAVLPATILPLKCKGYKLNVIGEEKIEGKASVGVKIVGADDKEFSLYFDKA